MEKVNASLPNAGADSQEIETAPRIEDVQQFEHLMAEDEKDSQELANAINDGRPLFSTLGEPILPYNQVSTAIAGAQGPAAGKNIEISTLSGQEISLTLTPTPTAPSALTSTNKATADSVKAEESLSVVSPASSQGFSASESSDFSTLISSAPPPSQISSQKTIQAKDSNLPQPALQDGINTASSVTSTKQGQARKDSTSDIPSALQQPALQDGTNSASSVTSTKQGQARKDSISDIPSTLEKDLPSSLASNIQKQGMNKNKNTDKDKDILALDGLDKKDDVQNPVLAQSSLVAQTISPNISASVDAPRQGGFNDGMASLAKYDLSGSTSTSLNIPFVAETPGSQAPVSAKVTLENQGVLSGSEIELSMAGSGAMHFNLRLQQQTQSGQWWRNKLRNELDRDDITVSVSDNPKDSNAR